MTRSPNSTTLRIFSPDVVQDAAQTLEDRHYVLRLLEILGPRETFDRLLMTGRWEAMTRMPVAETRPRLGIVG